MSFSGIRPKGLCSTPPSSAGDKQTDETPLYMEIHRPAPLPVAQKYNGQNLHGNTTGEIRPKLRKENNTDAKLWMKWNTRIGNLREHSRGWRGSLCAMLSTSEWNSFSNKLLEFLIRAACSRLSCHDNSADANISWGYVMLYEGLKIVLCYAKVWKLPWKLSCKIILN